MNRFLLARLTSLSVLTCLCLVAGCGGKQGASMSPVSGKVTVDGQPVTSGQVTFIPDVVAKEASSTQTPGLSTGQIGSDGSYKISTAGKNGAPLGQYKVTVTPSMVPAADAKGPPSTPFNPKYADVGKSDLRIEVVANPPAGAYDLKLTK
jgi:hypothetical protein